MCLLIDFIEKSSSVPSGLYLFEPCQVLSAFSPAGLVRYFLDLQEDDFESHVALLARTL